MQPTTALPDTRRPSGMSHGGADLLRILLLTGVIIIDILRMLSRPPMEPMLLPIS